MNTWLSALYWLIAGALIGFGVIAILSVGALSLLAGLIMVVFGAIRFRTRGLWATLVGGGALPLGILLYNLQNSDIQPATTAQAYRMMAVVFGAVAVLGLLLGVIAWARGFRAPTPGG